MKTILMGAAALSLIAAPAFAQSASADIQLGGEVAPACGLGNHISGASVNPLWEQGDINGIPMTDAEGQFNGASYGNRSVGNVWCNTAANVSFSVTPFATSNSTTDTGSFANSFDVRVTTDMGVYWGAGAGAVVQASVAGGTAGGNTGQAFETGLGRYSGMNIEILPAIGSGGNNKRPVAGSYSGSVTFTASVS